MARELQNIRVVCPIRIDFTGGFTDVMPFRATQWVSHVNLAVDMPVEVVLTPRRDDLIVLENQRAGTVTAFYSVDEIEERFSLIRTALKHFGVEHSITITVDSHAPNGAGVKTPFFRTPFLRVSLLDTTV